MSGDSSVYDLDPEGSCDAADLYQDLDLIICGLNRYSDHAYDVDSPHAAAAINASVPDRSTAPIYSDISVTSSPQPDVEPASPSTIPESVLDNNEGPASLPVATASEEDVVYLGKDSRVPPVRPTLQPADMLAVLRCTPVTRVAAVATRLQERFNLTTFKTLLTMLVIMHMARANLAQTLLDEAIQLRMAGTSDEGINVAGT